MNSEPVKTILIAGGSGLIGKHLIKLLESKSYRVLVLSRSDAPGNENIFKWNPEMKEIDSRCIEIADVVINLAGESIEDKRWTSRRKRKIINSRIFSTNLLTETITNTPNKIKLFINASAIGIYGNTDDLIMNENSPPANDFLGQVCKRWEQAAMQLKKESVRKVIFRIGIVLSIKGGFLTEIRKAMLFRIAPVFGTGNQYLSWIHIDDLCRMIAKSISDEKVEGTYNAVAPGPLSNKNFMKLMNHVLGGGYLLLKIPTFILKIILGEMSVMIIGGTRASSKKIESTGFIFSYGQANAAIRNVFGK